MFDRDAAVKLLTEAPLPPEAKAQLQKMIQFNDQVRDGVRPTPTDLIEKPNDRALPLPWPWHTAPLPVNDV